MSESDIIDYSEIFDGSKRVLNLLLGNGFSVAYKKEFSKINESNLIDDKESKENLGKKNKDFKEKQEHDVNEQLKSKGKKGSLFMFDKNKIKNKILLEEISKIHPTRICEMDGDRLKACNSFLSTYLEKGKIFTLNYDLLLHWALILNKSKYNDGFNRKKVKGWHFDKSEKVNIFIVTGL